MKIFHHTDNGKIFAVKIQRLIQCVFRTIKTKFSGIGLIDQELLETVGFLYISARQYFYLINFYIIAVPPPQLHLVLQIFFAGKFKMGKSNTGAPRAKKT